MAEEEDKDDSEDLIPEVEEEALAPGSETPGEETSPDGEAAAEDAGAEGDAESEEKTEGEVVSPDAPPPETDGSQTADKAIAPKRPLWVHLLVWLFILGLLGAGGAAGYAFWQKKEAAKLAKQAEKADAKKQAELARKAQRKLEAKYFQVKPKLQILYKITTEHSNFLTCSITLMAHDDAFTPVFKKHQEGIRTALQDSIKMQPFSKLTNLKGREKTRAEALQAVQAYLLKTTNKEWVEAVYFTDYMTQSR